MSLATVALRLPSSAFTARKTLKFPTADTLSVLLVSLVSLVFRNAFTVAP